jgi:hypothetical protein
MEVNIVDILNNIEETRKNKIINERDTFTNNFIESFIKRLKCAKYINSDKNTLYVTYIPIKGFISSEQWKDWKYSYEKYLENSLKKILKPLTVTNIFIEYPETYWICFPFCCNSLSYTYFHVRIYFEPLVVADVDPFQKNKA